MKKKNTKDQEQPHRLRLSRETIRLLNAPDLLGLARGGASGNTCTGGQTCECNTISEVNHNCYPTTCSFRGTGTTTNTEAP